jgi:hypothetical protein
MARCRPKLVFPYFTGTRPNTAFGNILEIRDSISTKYHALVLQANRRLTNGLQFQSSYTLSRAQDNGGSQSSATFTPGFLRSLIRSMRREKMAVALRS